jgi:hypothetical protein
VVLRSFFFLTARFVLATLERSPVFFAGRKSEGKNVVLRVDREILALSTSRQNRTIELFHPSLDVRMASFDCPSDAMGRELKRRLLTNRVRRTAKNVTSSYGRVMHLSHAEVGVRDKLQKAIIAALTTSYLAKQIIPALIILIRIFRNTGRDAQATALAGIIHIQLARCVAYSTLFQRLFRLDAEWFDIPLEEEQNHQPHRLLRQDIGIDSWSDQDVYENTGFRRDQLQKIYQLFGLEGVANQEPHVGHILVPTGFRFYHFYPEELFMFMMTRIRTGHDNKHLCRMFF